MWRSWLAHLVWDQRVVCSSHITPTKLGEILQAGIPPQGGIGRILPQKGAHLGISTPDLKAKNEAKLRQTQADKDSWLGENNHPLVWKGSQYEKKKAYETLYIYLCELNGISPYKQ